MRNLSFALTTRQMRERTKTVTRRRGTWWSKVLKPGDLVCAVEKSQGIPKGGLVRLGVIRIISVRVESLARIFDNVDPSLSYGPLGQSESNREGFPELTGFGFAQMFVKHMGGSFAQTVTRIEFEHVEVPHAEYPWAVVTVKNGVRLAFSGFLSRDGAEAWAKERLAAGYDEAHVVTSPDLLAWVRSNAREGRT